MDERYYGLNQQFIPKDVVPFDGPLQDRDRIENSNGVQLIWIDKHKGFLLFTDDPTKYLSINNLYSQWKKL